MTFGSFAKSYDDLMKSIYSFSLNFKSVVDYYDSIKTEYNKRFNNNNKANDSIAKGALVSMPKSNDSIAPNYDNFPYYGDEKMTLSIENVYSHHKSMEFGRVSISGVRVKKDTLIYVRDLMKVMKRNKLKNNAIIEAENIRFKNDSIKEVKNAQNKY